MVNFMTPGWLIATEVKNVEITVLEAIDPAHKMAAGTVLPQWEEYSASEV